MRRHASTTTNISLRACSCCPCACPGATAIRPRVVFRRNACLGSESTHHVASSRQHTHTPVLSNARLLSLSLSLCCLSFFRSCAFHFFPSLDDVLVYSFPNAHPPGTTSPLSFSTTTGARENLPLSLSPLSHLSLPTPLSSPHTHTLSLSLLPFRSHTLPPSNQQQHTHNGDVKHTHTHTHTLSENAREKKTLALTAATLKDKKPPRRVILLPLFSRRRAFQMHAVAGF